MRTTVLIVAVLLTLPTSFAQKHPTDTSSDTIFNFQSPFEHQVRLPDPVLNILRNDDRNRESFDNCQKRRKLKEIPAKWFVATEILITQAEPPALIVRADNACLTGPNDAPFWIFRRQGADYRLVFSARATSLMLLAMPNDGFRHIEGTSELAGVRIVREYEFTNEAYTLASKHVKTSQWLIPS